MKNKILWIFLSLLFEACTPTIKIDRSQEAVVEPYPVASAIYQEEVLEESPITSFPENTVIYNDIPAPEPIPTPPPAPRSQSVVPSVVSERPLTPPPPPVTPVSRPQVAQRFNISPLEVFDMLQDNPEVMLLDVRTPEEIPMDGKISGSKLIPLQVLNSKLNQLDKSKQIIVYCHTGERSREATKLLRSHGFDAINMSGGIQAWKRSHLAVRWK